MKKTTIKKAGTKAPAAKKGVAKKVVASPVESSTHTELSKVSELAKSLREFRFGSAGSKAKNTALPRSMRRARAKLLTAESLAKKGKTA